MQKPSDPNTPSLERTPGSRKKPYRSPRVTTYGALKDLTNSKQGVKSDGMGVPATKLS